MASHDTFCHQMRNRKKGGVEGMEGKFNENFHSTPKLLIKHNTVFAGFSVFFSRDCIICSFILTHISKPTIVVFDEYIDLHGHY